MVGLTCWLLLAGGPGTVAETWWIYRDGPEPGFTQAPWSAAWEARRDAAGPFLQLNDDHRAEPWAGVTFQRADRPLVLTEAWLATGYLRYRFNGGLDRYGSPNGELTIQARPLRDGIDFEYVNADFIDRGRGVDEDPGTWQEVLVPLRYWQRLAVGDAVAGVSLQLVNTSTKSWAFADIALVRFEAPPDWLAQRSRADTRQPEAVWPGYAELPERLRADRHPPRVVDGAFVDPDGRRVFLLNPYCREDHRLDMWGSLDPARRPPDHGTFDVAAHDWLYNQLLTAESLCRLGYNSYSATMPPQPWWDAVGYAERDGGERPEELAATYRRLGVPFFVDTVCWPWTIGQPANAQDRVNLPREAFTTGAHHWTPYRTIGAGREAWLRMWRLYAERYRDAGVPVVGFELFNEPAYRDVDAAHLAEFAGWLRERYATLEAVNATWGTAYATWDEAAAAGADARREPAGRFFDYDEYLAGRFESLVAAGVAEVTAILPDAPVGVQPMGGWALEPRESIWKHRLIRHETLVLTPTGGGRWTPGGGTSQPPASTIESPMAGAPLEAELLRSIAGPKMIVDNETYLGDQTRRGVRNRLWEHVLAGLDGLTVFSWSKRGWSWWQDAATVRTEADRFPYSLLNPYARGTDSLRGIADFAGEMTALSGTILPKPWGPAPTAGLLYSWPQARRRAFERNLPDKTPLYYAALKYAHWNLTVADSERVLDGDGLSGLRVLVAGGVRHIEPALIGRLAEWVSAGGTLIVGDEGLDWDLYGRPVDSSELLGVDLLDPLPGEAPPVAGAGSDRLPGASLRVAGLRDLRPAGAEVLLRAGDRPVLTRRRHDAGQVLFIAADAAGYPLAALLETALRLAGGELPLAADIRGAGGELAPNVLLSRRDHADRHALLMMNRDGYAKSLAIRLPDVTTPHRVVEALSGRVLAESVVPATEPIALDLPAGEPAVLLLEPRE